ncbi:ATP-dependent helicase HrpB [Sphingomonas glaciei]|uniref:ATP-dependent helicase HrpB n=1 Tax=Sphingomonas glaciei TaxID=2938948 RepID=A0ABY5MUI3_9SPHN|nr:ATP-dependent helicase HrpB [Sphingomonas glaciei]UUR08150.1 ATP-dependent helicase HrpB [Sphingomonas glaciei]
MFWPQAMAPVTTALPIHSVLPDLLSALRNGSRALLVAPPGAGKTTVIPPALLDQSWCSGQVLLLVPRRLAARAAAEFVARGLGEAPGTTVGYQTRLDSRVGKSTRLIAMTHGVFLSRLQADPELAGVSAVLFDEVHERSLDSDLALALTLDASAALRPDLRLLAMSATLDGERFAALLGDPPMIRSEGRSHPLTLVHLGRDAAARIEPQVAAACRRALADSDASVLAFLPGVAEIERTADALGALPPEVILHRLHGQVDPAAQRAALAPPAPGTRKLVLATSIAETSVTLDHVAAVVDSGLARRPRYDRGAGLTRLVTERASRAAVTQRAGRAARQRPGIAYRLWEEAAFNALPAHDPPEILEADLSSLLLTCLGWGEADPSRLPFLDPPPAAALAEARRRLEALGAMIPDGRLTDHGRAIARVPLEPCLAHMLIEASARGFGRAAADAAVLLTERGLGGNDPDLDLRHRRWRSDRGKRAEAARGLGKRFLSFVLSGAPQARSRRAVGEGQRQRPSTSLRTNEDVNDLGPAIALAFPDRLSRRRGPTGEHWQSVGGRGFRLDPASSLASAQWLAVAEVAGAAAGARILSAAAIDEAEVVALFGDRIETRHDGAFDPATGGVTPSRSRRLGAIRLSSGPDPTPDPHAIAAALVEGVAEHGLNLLPWNEDAHALRARAAFAASRDPTLPDLSDEALATRLDEWLSPLAQGRRRLSDIGGGALVQALHNLLGWDGQQRLDKLVPSHFRSPAGSAHPIDYAAPGGPTVEVRAQALFGLATHPMVAGGQVPLTLAITSPAGRPIQTSRDLPSFWAGSWREVAKEMRGRYPRHPWPDDPASATPTLRTKPRS